MLNGTQGDVQGQRKCGSKKGPMELWLNVQGEERRCQAVRKYCALLLFNGLCIWSGVSCILNTALERFLDFNIKLSLLII